MRVICIKKDGWLDEETNAPETGPVFGEECTISMVYEDCYVLIEYPVCKTPTGIEIPAYPQIYFIPISSIDETEMERNYKTEKQGV